MPKIEFDYYYGGESEQFRFLRIPEVLLSDEKHFGKLSYGAVILYALLLDRVNLSRVNGWFDKENRVYIIYTIEEISKKMKCSGPTAIKLLQELDDETGVGLISKVRRGPGQPTIIYVRNFVAYEDNETTENDDTEDLYKMPDCPYRASVENIPQEEIRVKKINMPSKKVLPDTLKTFSREVKDFNPNNTDNNYTDMSNIYNQSVIPRAKKVSVKRSLERMNDVIDRNIVEEKVKLQIDYDCLVSHRDEAVRNMAEEIKDIIVDVLCGERNIISDGNRISEQAAKSAYSRLTFEHVMHVIDNILNYPRRISKADRFIAVVLYNAAYTYNLSTFSGFTASTGIRLIE